MNLIDCLAAAIRDLQTHVPPEGWMVTEWEREKDGARAVLRSDGSWHALDRYDFRVGVPHPTAAAAMAAIEDAVAIRNMEMPDE